MYYESLYVISSLERLSVVLVRCVSETLVLYGSQAQYFQYQYSNMPSYDNSIFNISASIFSIVVFRSLFSGNYHIKLSK